MGLQAYRTQLGIAACYSLAGMLTSSASAVEVVVKNDSVVNGSTAAICFCFAQNEEAAAWLTSPCDGNIVAVQIFWRSAQLNTPQSLEDSIIIYSAGSFPNPGPIMINPGTPAQPAVLEGPVLTDGFLNEFRYLDEQQTVPLNIPVTQGQVFVVSLKFFNANEGQTSQASIVRDNDGCQAGKNTVFAIPPGFWFSSCSLGVQGDWMIRAVVNCPDTGGCCINNGQSCLNGVTSAQCTSQGGTFLGANVSCNADACKGACCIPPSTCLNVIQQSCINGGGTFSGIGTNCGTTVCFPMGACCLPTGQCVPNVSPAQCQAQGGTFQGNGVTCIQANCPIPDGACCIDSACFDGVGQLDCQGAGGTWLGPNSTCSAGSCADCPGDTNGDLLVNIDDLLNVISHWGACAGCTPPGNCVGDVTHNCVVNIDDLLGVINAWGACP